jgi:hypothetical protein
MKGACTMHRIFLPTPLFANRKKEVLITVWGLNCGLVVEVTVIMKVAAPY